MEHLNRVQIRGTVGSVRLSDIGGKAVVNFSVATEYTYKGKDGNVLNETTWHNVVCWQSESSFDLDKLSKGLKVYVEGRIRQIKYTSSSGEERILYEIKASRLESVKD